MPSNQSFLDAPRHLIDDPEALEHHVGALETCTTLGMDTEFVRERTFFPQPGLLQFSDGERI